MKREARGEKSQRDAERLAARFEENRRQALQQKQNEEREMAEFVEAARRRKPNHHGQHQRGFLVGDEPPSPPKRKASVGAVGGTVVKRGNGAGNGKVVENGSPEVRHPPQAKASSSMAQSDTIRPSTGRPSNDTSNSSHTFGSDVDTTRIVNMALSLGEARRVSRRNVSQQQNIASDAIMSTPPKPLPPTPRIASGASAMTGAPSFRYKLSNATLARAEKARNYLELMAQYRRLLELVPPVQIEIERGHRNHERQRLMHKYGQNYQRHRVDDGDGMNGYAGREYDPLRFVRGRRDRYKNKTAYDAEDEGFGNVVKVTEWVDMVAAGVKAETEQRRVSGSDDKGPLPLFAGARDIIRVQDAAMGAPQSAKMTVLRPRFEWILDPAEMIAEVYYTEQGKRASRVREVRDKEDENDLKEMELGFGPPRSKVEREMRLREISDLNVRVKELEEEKAAEQHHVQNQEEKRSIEEERENPGRPCRDLGDQREIETPSSGISKEVGKAVPLDEEQLAADRRPPPPVPIKNPRCKLAHIKAQLTSSGITAAELSRKTNDQWRSYSQLCTTHRQLTDSALAGLSQAARTFSSTIRVDLHSHRIDDTLYARINMELTPNARKAGDDAEELSKNLLLQQRAKVKAAVDSIDTLLRRRRRRFRWVRRGGWLVVEWALVGAMWAVWALVVLTRLVLGVGRGTAGVVRWLLWL